MHVETITVGPFASNCFLISNAQRDTLIIDPGDDPESIIDTVNAGRLQVRAILITHGHIDHVTGLAAVHDAFPVPIAMHPTDEKWAFGTANQMPPYYGVPRAPAAIERQLAEGQSWTDIGLTYEVLELPGHSPGHVGFWFQSEKAIFSGDVLFQGSVGRVDLPGGNGPTLLRSLQRLAQLPDETVVYCGHGPATTIGDEKRYNPYMRGHLSL